MLQGVRQSTLKAIEEGLDVLFLAGDQGTEAARECAMADLMYVARRCSHLYAELAVAPTEHALARATERRVDRVETEITGTPVGV